MAEFILSEGAWHADVYVAVFSRVLQVCIHDENGVAPTQRQFSAFNRFQSFPVTLSDDISYHAIRYCDRIDDLVNLEDDGVYVNKAQIGNHYRITSLLIPILANCATDYYFISADCDWEPEHGMQIIFENDTIVFCGDHSSLAFGAAWQSVLEASDENRAQVLRDILTTL